VPRARTVLAVGIALTLATGLSGCDVGTEDAGTLVVASTEVYGDLVSAVGGDTIAVSSIIDDPSKDPHEYEANARVQLELSHADLVVRNGGGYDDFIDTMLAAADNRDVPVIDAVELSGYDPASPKFNEHVWYDYPTVTKFVRAIESQLTDLEPGNSRIYAGNAEALLAKIASLQDRVAGLKVVHSGAPVAITEPVPLYLLDAIGLVNRTPPAFSEAVENATDVAPAVLRQTLELFSEQAVVVLVYNPQTAGPQTEAVLTAAEESGVPAVAAGELPTPGLDYVAWQNAILDEIETALI
jgi:zinc/manganese transport system substrate-binding protein